MLFVFLRTIGLNNVETRVKEIIMGDYCTYYVMRAKFGERATPRFLSPHDVAYIDSVQEKCSSIEAFDLIIRAMANRYFFKIS